MDLKKAATKLICAATAFSLILGTTASVAPVSVYAATNLDKVRASNPADGFIPVSLHPAEEYDRERNYFVKQNLNNFAFIQLKVIESDPQYQFTLNYKVEGDAWSNFKNGTASNNFNNYYNLYRWLSSFEDQCISNIAQLANYTGNDERKSKDYAINPEVYDQLVANVEELKKQIPYFQQKLNEIERYLKWLETLSSDDLKRYFGQFNDTRQVTIRDIDGIDDFSDLFERIELARYNMDLISRLVFGRDDLPGMEVESARKIPFWEGTAEQEKRTFRIGYCDDKGVPYGVTTKTDVTLKTTIIVEAPEDVAYKFTVLLDGKPVAASYDKKTGIVSAPVSGLSPGNHKVKVYVTDADTEIVPGADEQDIPPFPEVQWSFEVKPDAAKPAPAYEGTPAAGEERRSVENPLHGDKNVQSNQNVQGNKNGHHAVSVTVDGKKPGFAEAEPLIQNGRTLVPIRAFFESMGAVLEWNEHTRTVISTLRKGRETAHITLRIDSPFMFKEYTGSGGKKEYSFKKLDVSAQIINGSTYIPMRAAAEAFGYNLDWDPDTMTADLTFSGTLQEPADSNYPAYITLGDASALNDFELEVFLLTNEERMKNGLEPFVLNADLSLLARKKSQDMLDNRYFEHMSPRYGPPFDMMKKAGFGYRYAAENIARGADSPAEVVAVWMASPGHRANILNKNLTQIGIGFVQGGPHSTYWTQQFITP